MFAMLYYFCVVQVAKAAESREREAARDDHRRASSAVDPDDEEDPAADRLRAMNIQQVNFNESIVEERLEAFQDIQRNVGLVNEAFRDLAVLVADQQEDIGVAC